MWPRCLGLLNTKTIILMKLDIDIEMKHDPFHIINFICIKPNNKIKYIFLFKTMQSQILNF
jgi:hypothetical protein